jgi:hypothetical protein
MSLKTAIDYITQAQDFIVYVNQQWMDASLPSVQSVGEALVYTGKLKEKFPTCFADFKTEIKGKFPLIYKWYYR